MSPIKNTNPRILSKALANKIQQCIKIIIYYFRVEFIQGMQGLFNIWISIHVIHYINSLNKKDHMNKSINSEKAFTESITYS